MCAVIIHCPICGITNWTHNNGRREITHYLRLCLLPVSFRHFARSLWESIDKAAAKVESMSCTSDTIGIDIEGHIRDVERKVIDPRLDCEDV